MTEVATAGDSRGCSVVHLITGLDVGGAELALARLVEGLAHRGTRNVVVSMTAPGPVASRIAKVGVRVESLGLRRGAVDPRAVWRLNAVLDRVKPDVLQTWMYHADLLGTLARRRRGRPALVWSLRASDVDMRHYSALSWLTRKACVWLSARPDAIVANSRAGVAFHQRLGYHPHRWSIIANGIDTTAFRPDAEDRQTMREALGIRPDAAVVGLIGRHDPMKGHAVFLDVARSLLAAEPATVVVMAGEGVEAAADPFAVWLPALGPLAARVRLLGRRDDVVRIQRSLDVACSTSLFGEGFPNVLAEAMACGVPVVATDVGDAAHVVGTTGFIVPPGDAGAMVARCLELIRDPQQRGRLATEARARIVETFTMAQAIVGHEELYRDLTGAS